ncbi:MAG: peptidoglycan-associated lipoprotein Pal [bacterium]
MMCNKRNVPWGIVVVCIGFMMLGGCARPVQQRAARPLPPVEAVEGEMVKRPEEKAAPPSKIDVERLDSTIAKKTYPGIEGEVYETPMLKDCHFEFDRYDLTPEARRTVAENALIMKGIPNARFQVEGHCDERGTKEYNLALGERRAQSVKNYLLSLGIPEKNISTISYGEEMPVDPRSNEEAWAKNRRSHFVILSR